MNAMRKFPTANGMSAAFRRPSGCAGTSTKDVIRGRRFDAAHKFLPDGLSLADAFTTLSANEKRFVSQIQGRTYANVFGLVERFMSQGPGTEPRSLVRRPGCA